MSRALPALIALVATVALPAVARADDAPAPPERLLVLLGELADDLEAAGTSPAADADDPVDCDAVAVALAGWTDDHAGELEALVVTVDAYVAQLSGAEVRALDVEMAPYFDAVVVAAIECAEHDPTMTALDQMSAVLAPDATE